MNQNSEISIADMMAALESVGLKCKNMHRYILTQCPSHDDRNPSTQIFPDGWVNCMAGCGRFHITKSFPHLQSRESFSKPTNYTNRPAYRPEPQKPSQRTQTAKYSTFELIDKWKSLPAIPSHIKLKGIDAEYMHDLGWRWDNGTLGMGVGIFIPYFNQEKTAIPFAQVRHLEGDIRFHFLKDAQPRVYGIWNLQKEYSPVYIVEGCSDWLVLDFCSIPAVAIPSSSQVNLIKKLAEHAAKNGIELVYAGDNDEAGDKLLSALNETGIVYKSNQPPKEFNDWSDFFVAQNDLALGVETISNYCTTKRYESGKIDMVKANLQEKKQMKDIIETFGGGQYLDLT